MKIIAAATSERHSSIEKNGDTTIQAHKAEVLSTVNMAMTGV